MAYLVHAVVNQSLKSLIRGTTSNIGNAAIRASAAGSRGSNNMVSIIAEGFRQEIGNKADLQRVHAEVAAQMRRAVLNSFAQTVKSRPGQYRMGENRISGGILKSALGADSMAVGTPQGINFVDANRLDSEARHWRRLNFGARGSAVQGREIKDFPFRFDGVTLFRSRFPQRPSAPFGMPPGRFQNGNVRVAYAAERRGQDKFYPGGAGRSTIAITRGIRGRNFLDAGLQVMTTELPLRYELLVDVWLARAETSAKLPPKVTVGTGRYVAGGFRKRG